MKTKKYKSGTIMVAVDYGYDVHSLIFSRRTYERILKGSAITIKGQGFHWDAEFDQDYWAFNESALGSLYIYTAGGGEIFKGSFSDSEVAFDLLFVDCRDGLAADSAAATSQ